MRRTVTSVVVGCLALGAVGPASAAKIELSMSTEADTRVKALSLSEGARAYGWYADVPVQVYEATITADDGLPVENACLANGARFDILDAKLTLLGGVSCTNTTGKWQFVLTDTRVKAPTVLTAQLLEPATTLDGRVVSPTASNPVLTTIAPKIVLTSTADAASARLPIAGVVKIPTPRKLGTLYLERQTVTGWTVLEQGKTDARGRFAYTVGRGKEGTKTTFRIRYQTIKSTPWAPSRYQFTVTWI